MILVLACAPLLAQQFKIETIAGDGVANAVLNYPTSVVIDSRGNLYLGDWSGFIRKVLLGGGNLIVAGVGVLGYSGDGGQATSAMFGKAVSMALHAAGNIYIADGENNRIRRIDASTGIVTTVAGTGIASDTGDGGPAIDAGVSRPTGITVHRAGNLYFSNWSRVRKLTAATGIIETIAGQTTTSFGGDNGPAIDALFWDPVTFAVDRAGNLYLADYENSRIRMVTASTGIVTTIAGGGACVTSPPPLSVLTCHGGFAGDGGPATSALLNYPGGAAFDEQGNLYIADTINHRIRRVAASTGVISTIAGTGTSGFSGDGGQR